MCAYQIAPGRWLDIIVQLAMARAKLTVGRLLIRREDSEQSLTYELDIPKFRKPENKFREMSN